MRILVIGNMGYVGSVLIRHLRDVFPDSNLLGFDTGYFAHLLTSKEYFPEIFLDTQYYGDVRRLPTELLERVDVIIYLAALSNDSMGNEFEKSTSEINHKAAISIAKSAKKLGVKKFIFASSCSVYGFVGDEAKTEQSVLDPLTSYAHSKVNAEKELEGLAGNSFMITCLRFATACGFSPRLRLDLVLNDFVASAIAAKEITILSDGSPWRPLIHVKDMARAIEWAIGRNDEPNLLIINVGSDEWNYQVKYLAHAVQKVFEKIKININEKAQTDRRTYKVNFSLFKTIAQNYIPKISLSDAILDLKQGLEKISFQDKNFRNSELIRLLILKNYKKNNLLNHNLYWENR